MASFDSLITNLKQARDDRDLIADQLQEKREALVDIEAQIAATERKDDSGTLASLLAAKATLESEISNLEGNLQNAIDDANSQHTSLMNLGTPAQLVPNLDDQYPFLLLPVRVEARFMDQELWVRFFPDDIHVDTHEPELTPDEITSGKAYWDELWRDYYNDDHQLGAWRVLARAYGPERAAYIANVMTPTNSVPAVNDPSPPPPVFPSPKVNQLSWTRPAHVKTMPDRFVVRCYTGTAYIEYVGKPIPEPLIVGPDPRNLDDGFKVENDGRLTVDPGMLWMADFDEAVNIGMGVKIPISAQQATNGFDQVVVLGLRVSADKDCSKDMVQDLITHKRYMPGGFHLVPQGTPTNNTINNTSPYAEIDTDASSSFANERKDPLFSGDPGKAAEDKPDGEWLAELLGIDYETVDHISFADRMDISESMSMNQILWPTTMGYFMENMLHSVFDLDDIDDTRRFFTRYVSGRGPLPAFRVGEQPYGILPATTYTKLTFSSAEQVQREMMKVFDVLEPFWNNLIDSVSTVKNNNAGDWQEALLHIMGLHASSVEFHQRFALGPLLYWNLILYLGLGGNSAVNWWNTLLQKGNTLMNDLSFFPSKPRLFEVSHWINQTQAAGYLVDPNPLSEIEKLAPIDYITWLRTSSILKIRNEDFGGKDEPRALLYLLMRHAYLLENWDTAVRLLPGQNWDRLEKEFLNFRRSPSEPCDVSRWDMLFSSLVPQGETGPMNEFLTGQNISNYTTEAEFLLKTRKAMDRLADTPTARLERLMTEHLDLCTYRADAWLTGLVNYKLDGIRHPSPGTRQTGLYLGAFGWLLDLRPGPARQQVPDAEVPAAFNDPNALPLEYEPGNAGFVHGPSMSQATTAAVLRENYISKGGQEMEVNLSSERIRKAMQLIEGIQNGQELAALLGYRLERALHEGYPGLEMDQYLLPLRKQFPLKADQVTPTTGTSSAETTYAGEATESRNVLHGLNLLTEARTNGYPYGVAGLPVSGAVKTAIEEQVEEMEDLIDAIADLTMSEGVYHAVLGNYERAGAVLSALGEGKVVPEPEILRTPRTGLTITHRMGLLVDNDGDFPWPGVDPTARMIAEPVLNKYLGGLIGDPNKIVCKGVYITDEGLVTETQHPFTVSLRELNIQPHDFLRIMHDALENDGSELSQRIAFHVRSTNSLAHTITVKLDYQDRTSLGLDMKTFSETAPLISNLVKLVGESRPLNADDFMLPGEVDRSTLASLGIDYGYTFGLLISVYTSLVNARSDVAAKTATAAAITNPSSNAAAPGAFSNLRYSLMAASLFGIGRGVPESATGESDEIQTMLTEAGNAVVAELEQKKKDAEAALPSLINGSIDPNDSSEMMQEAAKALLGQDFVLVPRFRFRNRPELNQTYSDTAELLKDAPPVAVEEWMQGVAKVSAKIATYEKSVLLTEGLLFGQSNPPVLSLTPMQLPYKDQDRWLGMPFTNTEPEADTLSLVMQCSADFQTATGGFHSGLLIDEWQERLPSKEETTGIAYNYHEPDTEPPQSLLLAVTPKVSNSWNYEHLYDTLLETLEWAKKRGVEPKEIGETSWAQLIPGVMAPVSDPNATITLDYRINNES